MKGFPKVALLIALAFGVASGFCPSASKPTTSVRTSNAPTAVKIPSTTTTARNMLPTLEMSDVLSSCSTLTLAETQAWVQPTAAFLDPFLNFFTFAMLARVVLSWYPEAKENSMPWVLLVVPTQPLLKAVRGVIPPAFGVDITPVFYIAVFSFIHEILLGQQGLLTMKLKYGI